MVRRGTRATATSRTCCSNARCKTRLAQFHERCAPRDEVHAEWLYRFEGNEHLRSTSASGQLHALDALAVGVGGDEPRWRRYLSAMLAASPYEYASRREVFSKATNRVQLQRRGSLVEPRALAISLMHTREQLAAEWSHDARALLRGGADDARALQFINRVGAGSWSSDVSDPSEIGCADESSDVCEEPTAVPVFFSRRRRTHLRGSSPHPPSRHRCAFTTTIC